MTTDAILEERNVYQDAILESFDAHLRVMLATARANTIVRLRDSLSVTNGQIDLTAGNIRVLRTIDVMLERYLEEAGFPNLVEVFSEQFAGQVQFLDKIIADLSSTMKTPLPEFRWTTRNRAALLGQQAATIDQLTDVVYSAADSAKQKIMFSVAGLRFRDLAQLIETQTDASVGQAQAIADTAMNVFFRTAADMAYQQIEEDVPEFPQSYEYGGPRDKRNRPFCSRLKDAEKKVWKRAEIDKMDNGSLPNVFITCGGYRCRHTWILSTREIEQRFKRG